MRLVHKFIPKCPIQHNRKPGAFLALSCIVIAMSLTACSTLKDLSPLGKTEPSIAQNENFVDQLPPQDLAYSFSRSRQDIFKSGDSAIINVYNIETLSGEFAVDGLGNIHVPLLGKISVIGTTTAQLQETLQSQYGAQYLQDPNVSVSIEKVEIGKIVVDGAVREPGVFEVFETVYLSEAIALAGGLSDEASLQNLYIAREINNVRQVQKVDLELIREQAAQDIILYPYDIIFVQDSKARVAYNEFLRTLPLVSAVLVASTR